METGSQAAVTKTKFSKKPREGSKKSREGLALSGFTHYIWWKQPDEVLVDSRRLIAQVMNLGTWDDVRRMEEIVSRDGFVDALEHAEPGWFSPDKWHFWHYRLGLAQQPEDMPPVPVRRFN